MRDGTSSPSPIQGGPRLHNALVDNSSGVSPLEGRSAGFPFPGQCPCQ